MLEEETLYEECDNCDGSGFEPDLSSLCHVCSNSEYPGYIEHICTPEE